MIKTIKKALLALASFCGVGSIVDAKLEFSDGQSLTAGITKSTNQLNFGSLINGASIGHGTPIYLNVVVHTGAVGAATATIQVWLQTSADNATWASGIRFPTVTASQAATAGATIVRVALPAHDLAQYLDLVYDCGPGVTVTVDAWLSLEPATGPFDQKTTGWTA